LRLFTSLRPSSHETGLSAPLLSEPLHLGLQGEEVQVTEFASFFSRRFGQIWRNALGPE
jgi:hypothetical protein